MVARTKLYAQMERLEDELKIKLIIQLKRAVNGDNDQIFCAQRFSSHKQGKGRTDSQTDYLVDLGAQILVLKKKLDEPTENTIAEKICWYCRQWNEAGQSDASIVQNMAQQFLQAIESGKYN